MAKKTNEFGEPVNHKASGGVQKNEDRTELVQSLAHAAPPPTDDEKTILVYGRSQEKLSSSSNRSQAKTSDAQREEHAISQAPCVGWLVIWDGPGKGRSHEIHPGNNSIGRSESCDIALTHGDDAISSDGKIAVDYEPMGHSFAFVNRGSKNTPYVNGKPIRTECELAEGDLIKVGNTVLMFIAFCSVDRNWSLAP